MLLNHLKFVHSIYSLLLSKCYLAFIVFLSLSISRKEVVCCCFFFCLIHVHLHLYIKKGVILVRFNKFIVFFFGIHSKSAQKIFFPKTSSLSFFNIIDKVISNQSDINLIFRNKILNNHFVLDTFRPAGSVY